jgi:hypothetical protein
VIEEVGDDHTARPLEITSRRAAEPNLVLRKPALTHPVCPNTVHFND